MADAPAEKPVQPEVNWATERAPVHSNHAVLHSGPDGFLIHFCQMSRPPADFKGPPEAIICSSVHLSPHTFINTVLMLASGWNRQLDLASFSGPRLDIKVKEPEGAERADASNST